MDRAEAEALIARAKADLLRQEGIEARAVEAAEKAQDEQIKLRSFIEMMGRYLGFDTSDVPAPKPARGSRSRDIVDKAVEILRGSIDPIEIGPLANAIEDAGLIIGGQNRNANLAGYLSRDDRVRFLRGYGWVLTEEIDIWHADKKEATEPRANERSIASRSKTEGGKYATNDLDDDIPF